MKKCFFDNIYKKNNNSFLPGLNFNNYKFDLDLIDFDCCNGLGMMDDNNSIRVCELKKRLNLVNENTKLFELRVDGRVSHEAKEILADISKQKKTEGNLYLRKITKKFEKSIFSNIALIANWLFGIKVFYLNFSKDEPDKTLSIISNMSDNSPKLILLAGVCDFTSPNKLRDLMLVIDFAYYSMIPLWIEVIVASPQNDEKISDARSYRHKVKNIISEDPLDQLPNSTKERLYSFAKINDYERLLENG